jgi:hypothetical protein
MKASASSEMAAPKSTSAKVAASAESSPSTAASEGLTHCYE